MEPKNPEQNQAVNIEGVKLYCSICRMEVPEKRARGRSRATCGPECYAVLRKVIQNQLRQRKCPSCYHPSTPQEREDFMAWRKERGYRKSTAGRPKLKKSVDSSNSEQSTLAPSGKPA